MAVGLCPCDLCRPQTLGVLDDLISGPLCQALNVLRPHKKAFFRPPAPTTRLRWKQRSVTSALPPPLPHGSPPPPQRLPLGFGGGSRHPHLPRRGGPGGQGRLGGTGRLSPRPQDPAGLSPRPPRSLVQAPLPRVRVPGYGSKWLLGGGRAGEALRVPAPSPAAARCPLPSGVAARRPPVPPQHPSPLLRGFAARAASEAAGGVCAMGRGWVTAARPWEGPPRRGSPRDPGPGFRGPDWPLTHLLAVPVTYPSIAEPDKASLTGTEPRSQPDTQAARKWRPMPDGNYRRCRSARGSARRKEPSAPAPDCGRRAAGARTRGSGRLPHRRRLRAAARSGPCDSRVRPAPAGHGGRVPFVGSPKKPLWSSWGGVCGTPKHSLPRTSGGWPLEYRTAPTFGYKPSPNLAVLDLRRPRENDFITFLLGHLVFADPLHPLKHKKQTILHPETRPLPSESNPFQSK